MLDLSEEFDEENIATCAKYFKRMSAMKCWLEMEIGITGGEEDGVDNSGVDNASLYTKPEQVWNVYKTLSAIGPLFSIAAAFGNVHGVYKAGNVVLSPHLLAGHQEFIQKVYFYEIIIHVAFSQNILNNKDIFAIFSLMILTYISYNSNWDVQIPSQHS